MQLFWYWIWFSRWNSALETGWPSLQIQLKRDSSHCRHAFEGITFIQFYSERILDFLDQIATQHCECWEDSLSWSSQGHQSNLFIKVTIFPNMSLNIKVSSMSDLPCPPLNSCGSMVADSVEELMNNKVDYWMYFEYIWLIISILRSPLCMTFHVLPLKALEIG